MSIRILLADDHAIVRDGLELLLHSEPDLQVVDKVGTGRAAISAAARLQPDIAILDIAMPELSGVEATEQIQASSPATGVIILSMHATREHIVRAFEAGAAGYILKDSAGKEVVQAVRRVHAGQRYLSQRISDVLVEVVLSGTAANRADPLKNLTSREREVLQLVVEGYTSAQIGHKLALSPKTVETYRSRLMNKLGIEDLPGLVKFAIQQGLISLD